MNAARLIVEIASNSCIVVSYRRRLCFSVCAANAKQLARYSKPAAAVVDAREPPIRRRPVARWRQSVRQRALPRIIVRRVDACRLLSAQQLELDTAIPDS